MTTTQGMPYKNSLILLSYLFLLVKSFEEEIELFGHPVEARHLNIFKNSFK